MMTLLLATVVAVQDAEPCSPRLRPMTTTRFPYVDSDGTETNAIEVNSEASTETRALMVTYLRPAETAVGLFTVEGTAQVQNLSGGTRVVQYRMSTRVDDGFVPIFEQGSDLCWDATKSRIVSDYVFEVPANETVTEAIFWSCTIRRLDQIADINADGVVDGKDLGILFGQWSDTFEPGSD